jgi:hypothetical protein
VGGGQLHVVPRLHISVALQQKTANFKVAFGSRMMQWSVVTEEKQKNELAQAQFRCINTQTIIRGAITDSPSPLYQLCTAAKDGNFQGNR